MNRNLYIVLVTCLLVPTCYTLAARGVCIYTEPERETETNITERCLYWGVPDSECTEEAIYPAMIRSHEIWLNFEFRRFLHGWDTMVVYSLLHPSYDSREPPYMHYSYNISDGDAWLICSPSRDDLISSDDMDINADFGHEIICEEGEIACHPKQEVIIDIDQMHEETKRWYNSCVTLWDSTEWNVSEMCGPAHGDYWSAPIQVSSPETDTTAAMYARGKEIIQRSYSDSTADDKLLSELTLWADKATISKLEVVITGIGLVALLACVVFIS